MKHLIFFCLLGVSQLVLAQTQHQKIKTALKLLSPFMGDWKVNTQMIGRDGSIVHESGTYSVNWALDSTYLVQQAKLKNDSGRSREFAAYITFNADSAYYNILYFYSRTAFRVNETGLFDKLSKTFKTETTIVVGGRREYLRTELDMNNPKRLLFRSWSRFSDERNEVLDFTAEIIPGN